VGIVAIGPLGEEGRRGEGPACPSKFEVCFPGRDMGGSTQRFMVRRHEYQTNYQFMRYLGEEGTSGRDQTRRHLEFLFPPRTAPQLMFV